MEFLVFIIYVIVIADWIFGKLSNKSSTAAKGYDFYKTCGIFNMFIGMAGCVLLNLFLRDKGIIPVWFFWIAFIGFGAMMFKGTYYIYKMLVSLE